MSIERLSRRITAIAESATMAVDSKAKALKAAGEPVIGFGAGEPDFATPDHIVAAAVAACQDPTSHKYTPAGGLPALKEALVDIREAVACLEDALVSLGRAADTESTPPDVPVGTTRESLFQQLAAMPDGDKLFGHDRPW